MLGTIFMGLSVLFAIAMLVLCLTFAIIYAVTAKKNFNTLNRLIARYWDGVDLGVSSNEELASWVSKNTGIQAQKTWDGISLNGNLFAVDGSNKVRASFPEYERHILRWARTREDLRVPDKIDKTLEINRVFDILVKANNPGTMIDQSVYTINYSYRKLLKTANILAWIFLGACLLGCFLVALSTSTL